MKLTLTLLAAVLVLLLAIPYVRAQEALARAKPPAEIDRAAMLRAIRQKETGDRPLAIGPHGERTAYQFIYATWRIYSAAPHHLAGEDPANADRIAGLHLAFCIRQLQRRGLPVEPVFLAAAWRYGPWFALHCVRSDYARDVANLYSDYAGTAPRS